MKIYRYFITYECLACYEVNVTRETPTYFFLADGSTITLHDFPFNELEKGRILFQNWTGFLEYENPLTGEDIITRQHEADANAADQAAAYAAQQEQLAQQQQWAAQQQQQQQYVAPAQNNDAGCVGDPSLVW